VQTFLEFNDKVTRQGGYLAYELSDASRSELLKHFEPKYDDVICQHVTYKFPAKVGDDMPPAVKRAQVVGYEDSKDGIEALVINIDGSTKRGDGGLYHITLSLDRSKGKKPVHSNDMLKKNYQHVSPISIHLTPVHLN